MKLIFGIAAFVLISACSSFHETPAPEQDSLASTCLAGGGTMKQVGKLQNWKCITPYKDAGKVCSDSSQCEGACQTNVTTQPGTGQVNGTCQADNNHFGCSATVVNGKLGRALCVD